MCSGTITAGNSPGIHYISEPSWEGGVFLDAPGITRTNILQGGPSWSVPVLFLLGVLQGYLYSRNIENIGIPGTSRDTIPGIIPDINCTLISQQDCFDE